MKSAHTPLNILSLKLIVQILDPQSSFAEQERAHEDYVGTYALLIPAPRDAEVPLAGSITAYGIGGANKLVQFVRIYLKAHALIKQSRFDVLTVADSYYLALVGWLIARRYHLGFEVQVHGFEKFSGMRALLAKRVLPRADAIRVVSLRLKKLLIAQFGIPEGKITVAPLFFVDTTTIPRSAGEQALSAELDVQLVQQKGDDFVFLTIGRLVPVKNIGLQLRAFKNLLARYPDTQLWVAGDGPERGALEAAARELGIADRVRFWGWHADPSAFYAHADSFLLSSDSEGWGLVVVEAAAHGLPVLMTDVGCAGEFIRDGENGLVVPVGGQQGFEAGMLRLREQVPLRASLGRAARSSLAALPSGDELIGRYVSSWEKSAGMKCA
ncbi:MAG: glycosyltransferase [Minisyncoccota bacterium]